MIRCDFIRQSVSQPSDPILTVLTYERSIIGHWQHFTNNRTEQYNGKQEVYTWNYYKLNINTFLLLVQPTTFWAEFLFLFIFKGSKADTLN